jgi:hypothetical protein
MTIAQRARFVAAAVLLAAGFAWVRVYERAPRAARLSPLAPERVDDVLVPDVDPDPELPPAAPGLSIRGVVVDEAGEPLAGINVSLRSLETGISNQNSIRSGPDGGFELPGLPRGRYQVLCWSNNRSGSEADGTLLAGAIVDEVEAGRSDLRVTLRAGRFARGVVQDKSGAPLAGVFVCANTARGARIDAKRSGADGSFEVLLPPGEEFELEARPPTERASTRADLAAPPDSAAYARLGGVKAGDSGLVLRFRE